MAELSTKERNKLDPKTFVFPKERRYPIPDIAHARNALARSSGKSEEGAVKAAVHKKFPSLAEHDGHDDFKDDCAHCMQDKAEGKLSASQQEANASNAVAAEHDEKHGKRDDCPYCKARKDGFCALHKDDTLTPDGPIAAQTPSLEQSEQESMPSAGDVTKFQSDIRCPLCGAHGDACDFHSDASLTANGPVAAPNNPPLGGESESGYMATGFPLGGPLQDPNAEVDDDAADPDDDDDDEENEDGQTEL